MGAGQAIQLTANSGAIDGSAASTDHHAFGPDRPAPGRLRIAHGLIQRERAERLGVSESIVSRDEWNEYHGITVERAQRILDALEESVTTRVEEPAARPREREPMGAA